MSFPARPTGAAPVGTTPARGLVLGPDDGDPYHWLGTLTLTKILGDRTGDGLDIVDHRVPPGYAPPRHVHRDSDEVFFLLDGTLEVTCGEDRWEVSAGSLVFLPRGVPHGFVAGADGPARTLLINAPAGFGEVIVELGTAAADLGLPGADVPMPAPEQINAVSLRYGIESAPGSGS